MSLTITVTPGKIRRTIEALGRITATDKILEGSLTPSEVAGIMALYEPWRPGVAVEIDMVRRHQGQLYKVIQAHTTQAGWEPPDVPALWAPVVAPGVIPAWTQPDSTNPFRLDDQVVHKGRLWLSRNDANVWEPSAVAESIWEDIGVAP